jgi:hypothetical protein
MPHTTVAVADLHGHRHLFDALLARLDAHYGDDYTLVTLGDYVDNGREIPALLDRLVTLKAERGPRFVPIMGNHDLACLRAIGWEGGPPDEAWEVKWLRDFGGTSTAEAYGVTSARALATAMPAAHRAFLQALPWYHAADGHVFVHSGLRAEPVVPQLAELARRELLPHGHTQPQLRDRALATVSWSDWGHVVVTAHTHEPGDPHFVTDHRVSLSSDADHNGHLWAVVLPQRRFLRVDPSGTVTAPLEAPAALRRWAERHEWREVAIPQNGYTRAGSLKACADRAHMLRTHRRAGRSLVELSTDDLCIGLFFLFRAARHSDSYDPGNEDANATVDELVARLGEGWLAATVRACGRL